MMIAQPFLIQPEPITRDYFDRDNVRYYAPQLDMRGQWYIEVIYPGAGVTWCWSYDDWAQAEEAYSRLQRRGEG